MATDDKLYNKGSNANDSAPPPPPPPKLPPVNTGGVTTTQDGQVPSNLLPNTLSSETPTPAPKGIMRFNEELRRSGFSQGTPDYENFILKMVPDSMDGEYTAAVYQAQAKVRADVLARQKQQSSSAYNFTGILGTSIKDAAGNAVKQQQKLANATDDEKERAQDLQHKKDANFYLGPHGQFVSYEGSETASDPASLGNSLKPGGQSQDTANGNTDPNDYSDVTDSEYIQAGGAVWIGDRSVTSAAGNQGNQAVYRNAGDMMNDVYRWNTAQTAAFQKSIGLDVTGVADDKTVAAWKWAINTARYYTAMGQKRTVDSILQQAKSQVGGRGGGGGGGGGGAGASVPADAAKRLLNQAMKQYAGREATAEELKAFLPAIRAVAGSSDFDASQFAVDWVRGGQDGARSSEVANFQAATDYYSVVQQVIGGH